MTCSRAVAAGCIVLAGVGLLVFVSVMIYTNISNCMNTIQGSYDSCKSTLLREYYNYLSIRNNHIWSTQNITGKQFVFSLGNDTFPSTDISTTNTPSKGYTASDELTHTFPLESHDFSGVTDASRDVSSDINQYADIHPFQNSVTRQPIGSNLVPLSFNITWSENSTTEEVNNALNKLCQRRVSTHECIFYMWITVAVYGAILLVALVLMW